MPEAMKRVTVYVSAQTYQRLRVLLAMEDKTVSQWFRDNCKELEEQHDYAVKEL